MLTSEAGFGRRVPETWVHVERHPLSAVPDLTRYQRTPIVLGINWYSAFERPTEDGEGRYWIGVGGQLGSVLGGHAILIDDGQLPDRDAWYHFYNQGGWGACVGFSFSRAMTQWYRVLFDAMWLWDRAKESDEWGDTNPGDNNGTSLDAAASVLLERGSLRFARDGGEPNPIFGVSSYKWARNANEVLAALDSPLYDQLEAVPLLNSWGEDYPRVVWLPLATLERLLGEQGEACVLARH